MATAADIVQLALKDVGTLGVGQTALAEDSNDAFTKLKMMIAQWQAKRWLVPSLQDVSAVGNGQISNPIGTGLFYNIQRPDKIQAAYVRLLNTAAPNQVDLPLRRIDSYEDYSQVCLKTLNSFPYAFFYDNQYPIGNVFIWPIPNNQYEIHLIVKSPFIQPTVLADDLIFPDEYQEALYSNLVIRLCNTYQINPMPSMVAIAKTSLNTIRNSNTQISELRIGSEYNGWYNIFADVGG